MKKIIIDGIEIEIPDESYEAFKKQFVEKDKAILWKPENSERYWTAGATRPSRGGVSQEYKWFEDNLDVFNHQMGNIFKTKEEAQEALETGWIAKRKAEVKILRFIAENDLEFEPDWEDDNQKKWYLLYDRQDLKPDTQLTYRRSYSTLPYFKSLSDAQKVIDAMTPELKILFGVK